MNPFYLFILLLNFVFVSWAKELPKIVAEETANLLTLLEESENIKQTLNEEEKNNLDEIINKRKKLLNDLLNTEKKKIDETPQNDQTELDLIIKKRISLLHQLLKNKKTKEILQIINQVGKENFLLDVDGLFKQPTDKEEENQEVSIKPNSRRNENETTNKNEDSKIKEPENSTVIYLFRNNQNDNNKSESLYEDMSYEDVKTSSENDIPETSEVTYDPTVRSYSTKRMVRIIAHRPRVREKRVQRTRKPTTEKLTNIYRAPPASTTITTPDFRHYFDTTTPYVHDTKVNPHNDFKTVIIDDDDVQFNEILQQAEKLYVTAKTFNFCFDNNSTDFNTNQYTSTTTPKTMLWSDKDILQALGGDPFIKRLMKIYMKKNQEFKGARKAGHVQYFGYRK